MTIFVVRHAETDDNATRVIQVPSAHLSEAGRAQAAQLAERIAARGVAHILTSDLVRAVETAAYLRARLGIEIEKEPLLRERDFGDLRGYPYATLSVDPFGQDYVPPNGESWVEFHSRVNLAWERIKEVATRISGNLLVVTHGLVCRVLVEKHFSLQPSDAPPLRWENCSLTEIDAVPPWMIRRLNCVEHLASVRRQAIDDKTV